MVIPLMGLSLVPAGTPVFPAPGFVTAGAADDAVAFETKVTEATRTIPRNVASRRMVGLDLGSRIDIEVLSVSPIRQLDEYAWKLVT
jgi:hypothetical protein